jgi:hypothetical protein
MRTKILATKIYINNDFDERNNHEHFLGLEQLLYYDPLKVEYAIKASYTSNELNFYEEEIDTTPSDIVVGFSINKEWDTAIRTNAKGILFVNLLDGPLRAMEYFYRPLLLEAKNPIDFLSLLFGIALPETETISSLDDAFYYFDEQRASSAYSANVFKDMISRLVSNPKINSKQVEFITSYYDAFITHKLGEYHRVGPFHDHYVTEEVANIYSYFKARYMPAYIIIRGADSNKVYDPKFSFLSSQESFEHLKSIMQDNVSYMKSSLYNDQLPELVSQHVKEKGYEKVLLSISNIVDITQTTEEQKIITLEYLKQSFYDGITPQKMVFSYTTNRTVPYGFFSEDVDQNPIDNNVSGKFTYNYQQIEKSIEKEIPVIKKDIVGYMQLEYTDFKITITTAKYEYFLERTNPNQNEQFFIHNPEKRSDIYDKFIEILKGKAKTDWDMYFYLEKLGYTVPEPVIK